jgi:3-hydroxyisobutyrate dehydrogenase-like beta-hydroxyacid dehydrogenase
MVRHEDDAEGHRAGLELGRSVKMPLPTTSVANEYLTAGRATGLEKKDFAAIFQVLAKLSGVNE